MNNHNDTDDSDTSYYDMFGLSSSASDEEIRSAYTEQTKKYHPDRIEPFGAEFQLEQEG